jgi:CelD/BcsL family acetyltransferase involved in cellulose biosynthesis
MSDPGTLSVLRLESVDALRRCAEEWDDLWLRSSETRPTARAESLASWMATFQPSSAFHAIILCQQSKFLAALPLNTERKGTLINSLNLPGNEWSPAGTLLMDTKCDGQALADRLVAELGKLPTGLLWFENVPADDTAWQHLLAAADRAGLETDVHFRWSTGWIDVSPDGAFPVDGCSRNFRQKIRKSHKRLLADGVAQLRVERPTDRADVLRLLDAGWKIEHSGWKGQAGSSVASHREIRSFFDDQACQMADWGQLALAFLDLDGQPIAFEYAWWAKQVHHAMKIAYDERFGKYRPGQLLMYLLLDRFQKTGECNSMDLIGPISEATSHWRPRERRTARVLMAPRGLLNRAVVKTSRHLLPQVRGLRDRLLTAPAT